MSDWKAYFRSFGYAIEGLVYAFKEHSSFRTETIAAIIALSTGCLLGISREEWLVLIILVFSVLVAELLNTSIETALDYLAFEHHISVKVAKDVAAGAVFLLSLGSVVIGLIIFLPYIFELLG